MLLLVRFIFASHPASVAKNDVLTLFVSITSGPHNHKLRHMARQTWLSPCIASPTCDYRYFIDTRNVTASLLLENKEFDDLVFRDSCDLMLRHPDNIHYGNSPVEYDPMFDFVTEDRPNYYLRRMYKIDWKNCFMRWARDNFSMDRLPLFHVYVEDDSFNCMDNLLHQTALLEGLMYPLTLVDASPVAGGNGRRLLNPAYTSFRTGFQQRDGGFDDSSTFMNKEVVEAFLTYYPDPARGFDCGSLLNNTNEGYVNHTSWLSWGNSWMLHTCNWVQVLKDVAGIEVNKPLFPGMCYKLAEHNPKADHLHIVKLDNKGDTGSFRHIQTYSQPEDFPCFVNGIIHHGAMVVESLLTPHNIEYNYTWHICEYFLFIDKVKAPAGMMQLWNATHFKCKATTTAADHHLHWDEQGDASKIATLLGTISLSPTPKPSPAPTPMSKWDQYSSLFSTLHTNSDNKHQASPPPVPSKIGHGAHPYDKNKGKENEHAILGDRGHRMGQYLRRGMQDVEIHPVDHRPDCPDSFTIEDAAKLYSHHYHNMSVMFLHNGQDGYKLFMDRYIENSYYCHLDKSSSECKADIRRRTLTAALSRP